MLYVKPITGLSIDDCHFYHTVDVPGVGEVVGDWDLRPQTADMLGRVDFQGQRVLEIGPASGYLTYWMERAGADVTSIELPDDPGWDFVPYPDSVLAPIMPDRRRIMTRLKNSYWFMHEAFGSKAKLVYGDACNLDDGLGEFDIAVLANVLLHTENPVRIIQECAKRSRKIILCEMHYPELEGQAVCRLVPTAENQTWDTWWNFSSDFFVQYLKVLGYNDIKLSLSEHEHMKSRMYTTFTVVASR